jgi:single-strand DNA-binding protein
MNTVQLIGRWTSDPELRYAATGTAVCTATLAVNRRFKKDEADFLRVVMFKQTAEAAANYTKKGSQVAITGTIQTGSYTKDDGTKVFTTDIIADNLEFLEKKSADSGQATQKPQQNYTRVDNDPFANSSGPIEVNSDDLPF